MRTGFRRLSKVSKDVWHGKNGITGLETAIVLIAFIVVAAVFAFAVLTTGLFSTEKAKQTALAGLEEATNTLEPKGAVVGFESIITADTIDSIQFKLTNSAGADSVGLKSSTTLITYADENNQVNAIYTGTDNEVTAGNFQTAGRPTIGVNSISDAGWGHDWILGTGDNVDPGEVVRITVNVAHLGLGASTPFKIEIIPGKGAVITIQRTTPLELSEVMDLD